MKLKLSGLVLILGALSIIVISATLVNPTIEAIGENKTESFQNTKIPSFDPLQSITAIGTDTKISVLIGNKRKVNKRQLENTGNLGDIIEHFPKNWISEYREVQLQFFTGMLSNRTLTCNSYKLTPEQIQALQMLRYGDEFAVIVNYIEENHLTDRRVVKKLEAYLKVTPEMEADFPGGYEALRKYMEEHLESAEFASIIDENPIEIVLEIDEEGTVGIKNEEKIDIDQKIKAELFDHISKMPMWQPAEDMNGEPINQEITLIIGGDGC